MYLDNLNLMYFYNLSEQTASKGGLAREGDGLGKRERLLVIFVLPLRLLEQNKHYGSETRLVSVMLVAFMAFSSGRSPGINWLRF